MIMKSIRKLYKSKYDYLLRIDSKGHYAIYLDELGKLSPSDQTECMNHFRDTLGIRKIEIYTDPPKKYCDLFLKSQ